MAQGSANGQSNLSKQAVRNTLWAYLSYSGSKLLSFVTTVILARLLLPEQFGIVGYCLIAFQYLDLLNDVGIGHALIARRDKQEEAANAAFVIGLGVSLALFAMAWLGAPGLAGFFNEPQVTDLFRVLAFAIIISAFGIVPGALLQRDLRFKDRMVPSLATMVVKGVVAISMALAGFGVWSLIWSQLLGQITNTAISWWMVRWWPTRAFDRETAREMLRYGLNITAVSLLGSFMVNVDYLLVGRLLGAAALGYYTMAFRIPELVIRSVSQIVTTVAFPVLSKAQLQVEQMRTLYFAYLRYMALFTFPAGVGIAILAGPFIQVFLGPVWAESIAPMQFIALASGFSIVSHLSGIIYNALGKPEITRKLSLAKLPLVLVVLYAGTFWGVAGVAAGHVVLTLLCMVIDAVMIRRAIDVPLTELARALQPALIGTAAMAVALLAASSLIGSFYLAALLALPFVGLAVYAGTLWLVSRETLVQARTVLRGSFARG
jgi:O-antigen/teichoic acid export membrane protein